MRTFVRSYRLLAASLGAFRIQRGRKKLRRTKIVMSVSAAIIATLSLASIALATQQINSAGPLTRILITDQLNCGVSHAADTSPEFYGDTACGTFVAVGVGSPGSQLFGPSNVPAGGNASPRTSWTQVSQSAVTGSGTSTDPYRIVTIADAGTTGIRVTETDSYVVGQEAYRTDVALSNSGSAATNVIVYRAADCYLQNSDAGFGRVDPATGAVACTADATPSSRIEQWFPLTPGSHYYHAAYSQVWSRIGQQLPFPDTCRCSENIDNGAGLSWSLIIPAGTSTTVSHFTTFSPLGIAPLSTRKTADAATAAPGSGNGYTITVSNPSSTATTLNSITDTLPAGFSYVSGSTTGVTTANPTVSGQVLTWSGPFSVPGSGSATLHFNVTVSTVPGVYFNNAGGDAGGVPVAPTGPTAQITVGSNGAPPPQPPTTTTTTAAALLVANSAACGQVTLTATGLAAGLAHQIVTTPSTGGPPSIVNVTPDASQRVTATIATSGGIFTSFVRMSSNQVTVSNTVTFAVAACPTPTATPTPVPTAKPATPAPTPTPTPTPAPVGRLPSTSTGDGGFATALALMGILTVAAIVWRKRPARI